MIVKHKIDMDFLKPDQMPVVEAVQKDQYSRQLELTLYADGEPFVLPEDVRVVACFVNKEGKGGSYDALPDGSQAWSASGNVVTLDIAPQVMAVPGPAMLSVDLWHGSYKLSTFAVLLYVRKSLQEEADEEVDYTKLMGFLPVPENPQPGHFIRIESVDDKGGIICLGTADLPDIQDTVESLFQEAVENGGLKGESAYELAVKNGYEGTEAEWVDSLNRPANGSWGRVAAQRLTITSQLITDPGITVNFGGNRLRGVNTPTDKKDATNKQYVDSLVQNPYPVPSYWQTAVDGVIEQVQGKQDLGGINSISFAWFSDCHMVPGKTTPNTGNTGILAAAVMDACHIPFAVFSGDAARQDGDTFPAESQIRQNIKEMETKLKPIGWNRLLQTTGEHDIFWGTGFGNSLNNHVAYNAVYRKQSGDNRRVFGEPGSYYYVDDRVSKVRFIILNTHMTRTAVNSFAFGDQQLNWLVDKALSFADAGWSVVFVAHVPCNMVQDFTVFQGILNAFYNGSAYTGSYGTAGAPEYVSVSCNYVGKHTADLIGYFCGHVHEDRIVTGSLPCAVVSILSDAMLPFEEGSQLRTSGTADEHVLDFVTVDKDSRMVYLTRLGAGENRSFSY